MEKSLGRLIGYGVEKVSSGWQIHLRFERGWLVVEQWEKEPYVLYYDGWWAREFDDGDGWYRVWVRSLRDFIGYEAVLYEEYKEIWISVNEDLAVHIPYKRLVSMSEKPLAGSSIRVRR